MSYPLLIPNPSSGTPGSRGARRTKSSRKVETSARASLVSLAMTSGGHCIHLVLHIISVITGGGVVRRGVWWCAGFTPNLESFHFPPPRDGARPTRGSYGPRCSALGAGPGGSRSATAPLPPPGTRQEGEPPRPHPATAAPAPPRGPGRSRPGSSRSATPRAPPAHGPARRGSPSGLCARVHAVILLATALFGVHGALPAALSSRALA